MPRSENPVTKTLANNLNIPVGKTYYYKLVITLNYLETIDQTSDLKALLSTDFNLSEAEKIGIIPKMVQSIIDKSELPTGSVKSEAPIFATPATTDETVNGLYAMEDDYGTSYYFRGIASNNYVKFADFYWRIIRINGDGSLRILYDGTSPHSNSDNSIDRVCLTDIVWNLTNNNDAKYVGYMYGGLNGNASVSEEQAQTNETNTNIKLKLEEWYKNNISNKNLDETVADSIYCNDRTTPGKTNSGWNSDTGNGFGLTDVAYGSFQRTGVTSTVNVTPQLKCLEKNDAFTKNDILKGNGALDEKVGMISTDEIVLAGSGRYGNENNKYYLFKGNEYWSFSPRGSSKAKGAVMFEISKLGGLGNKLNNETNNLVPVISLTPEYASDMIGDGTMTNPYRDLNIKP